MKKTQFAFNAVMMSVCGWVLHNSFAASGAAAWSFVISSVNHSPFETIKPYTLVFIMWTFIELSCMRPRLLHFVSVRILSLFAFVCLSLSALCLFAGYLSDQRINTAVMIISLVCAEVLQFFAYRSKIRAELFFVPLMTGFGVIFFALIFCTFYPPHWGIFYDAAGEYFGYCR